MLRILALVLLLMVVGLQYRLWISDGGMREVWRLRREVTTQTDQNEALKQRNRTLAAEVQDLKKGKSAIEERARTDLGMVGSNETFFQVAPRNADVNSPTSNIKPPVMANGASDTSNVNAPRPNAVTSPLNGMATVNAVTP